jgi:YidC/Oxa1 family membrane protein insertase
MATDKNTIIGFVLIGILLMGMFYFNNKSNNAFQAEKQKLEKHRQDSIDAAKPKINPAIAKLDSLKNDTLQQVAKRLPSTFNTPTTEELTVLENQVLKITFTNKGAQPKEVELKQYKTSDGKPLILQKGNFNKISYKINAGNKAAETADNFFITTPKVTNADKSQTISFNLKDSAGEGVTHQYTLKDNDYLLDFNITLNGSQLVTNNAINILWQTEIPQMEKDLKYEGEQTNFGYLVNDKYDFVRMGSGGNEKFDKPTDWISVNPQFFVTALVAKNKFTSAELNFVKPFDSLHLVTQATTNARLAVAGSNAAIPLQLYYGPNDYTLLKKYGNKMEQIVPYGSGPFSFVKYINRHFLLPVFDFIRGHVASYGMVILLITLLIRLITSPILYKSYLSGAKMKALKPEVDALRAKNTDPRTKEFNQQAFGVEQMKLWKTAGVSPLGGCLPALLQIPIFMSLYYFFQSNIALRGHSFLWAKDLAAYDSIYTLPFSIPFYGDHISLFTLTATLTSLLISIYSMSSMQDNTNPVMKYMPYIFPVMLLGVFNNLPSALTWYYTISNTITLLLQIGIQKYIINPDKIRASIAENMKKPVKQSKFQERLQAMQESQKKMQDLKNKGK